MSPWTALLESLHSAVIDELVERHPEPKPELSMPVRRSLWSKPSDLLDKTFMCRVEFPAGAGVALLAMEPASAKKLGVKLPELWKSVLKRAGSEFARRGIQPKLDAPFEIAFSEPYPKGLEPEPKRWVWIPIKLQGDACFLGIAA